MRRSQSFIVPVAVVVAVLAMSLTASPAAADEHLRNGDFAQGAQNWLSLNATVASCHTSDGSAAMRLAPTSGVNARVRQRISGPLATGTYVLTGRIIRMSGTRNLVVSITPMGPDDAVLEDVTRTVAPGDSYAPFEVQFNVNQSGASALIDFTVASSSPGTVICIDSLSLQGPPLATATPIPTNTPAATATSRSTPTRTPTPARTPTATPTRSSLPSLTFQNGDFEDGANGWQKFGGELDTTSTPRVSGLRAGVLRSATSSTKWAYQTVAIDSTRHYEFSGYLQPGQGVASGSLRISWYASSDGSGEAISTTDSTASVSATSARYVWLTTGSVQPPPGAKTARPRVLLAPASAANATLFMDDLEFGVVSPATPTVAPRAPTAPPRLRATPTRAPRVLSASDVAAVVVETPGASPEPTHVSDVSSTRVVATPPPVAEVSGVRTEPPTDDDGVPLIWLVGTGAFVVGLGGAYLQGRRRT